MKNKMRYNICICKILQLSEFISKEKNSLSDHALPFWIQNNTVTISRVSILIWLPSNGYWLPCPSRPTNGGHHAKT